jgi:hypothetical protein
LAGGVPNPKTFPFDSCSFKLKDGSSIEIPSEKLNGALQYTQTVRKKIIFYFQSKDFLNFTSGLSNIKKNNSNQNLTQNYGIVL